MATDPEPYPGDKLACEKDWVRDEVAAALHLAPVTAGARLFTAEQAGQSFPKTLALLESGQLPGHYAAKLVDLTNDLTDKHATEVEKRVLGRAS